MPEAPSRLLIIGCGYLGMRVAARAQSSGWSVWGTSRHRLATLQECGLRPVRFDWNESQDFTHLSHTLQAQHINRILIAVSYDRSSSIDRYTCQVDGLVRLLRTVQRASLQGQIPMPDIAYVSTTGVYHQTGGVWVDERSPTRPTRDGGRAHLLAEAKMRACLGDSPWTILRMSGLYGPGRVPRAADVRAGRPIASPPDGHLNLIHIDDAATAVVAALSWPDGDSTQSYQRQRLYVVSDDRPILRREFYQEIAYQTRAPEPRFIDPAADSGVRFRSETDKRVWNRLFKRDLVPKLQYPTYAEGLHAIL